MLVFLDKSSVCRNRRGGYCRCVRKRITAEEGGRGWMWDMVLVKSSVPTGFAVLTTKTKETNVQSSKICLH